MISVVLKGGLAKAKSFLEKVKNFSSAESLIEHPGIMPCASILKEKRAALGIDEGQVLLSVGIDDLISD